MRQKTKRLSIIAILMVFVASFLGNTAFADDINFFSNNDILFYSEQACTVQNQTGDIAVIGNDNAEKIFKFLISTPFKGTGDKPFNAVQAAGALGNFFQESGMDPGAQENGGSGPGRGLAQWSFDRRDKLFALAQSEGKQWSDLGVQLKMIQIELNGSEGDRLKGSFPEFATVTDPARASYLFQQSYERAGIPAQANRDSAARSYFEKFKSLAPGDVTVGGSSSSCGGNTNKGISNYAGADFTVFNQCQYEPYGGPWGTKLTTSGQTMCKTGCIPTSLAMAIKNMTGQNVTPQELLDFYNQENFWLPGAAGSGVGGIQPTADKWGLRVEPFNTKDVNAYKDILGKGGLIMVAGRGPAPYMPTGHAFIIRGLTDKGTFIIADPGQGVTTNGEAGDNRTVKTPKEWPTAEIMVNADPSISFAIYKK